MSSSDSLGPLGLFRHSLRFVQQLHGPTQRVSVGVHKKRYKRFRHETSTPGPRWVLVELSLGLQPYPQEVVRAPKPTPTIFSGGGWSPRVYTVYTPTELETKP